MVQDQEQPSTAARCSRRQWPGTELIAAGIASAGEKEDAEPDRPWMKRKTKDFKKWGGRR